ncbi:hypothetical protein JHK85_036381 [Glycine max]|nr:hypothetical protein JHK85_036381 [Glycine max]
MLRVETFFMKYEHTWPKGVLGLNAYVAKGSIWFGCSRCPLSLIEYFIWYVIMVLVKGSSSRESIGGEFNIHGYNNVVYEVSFDFHSLRSDFSSLIDFSAFKGSSNLLANMAKKVLFDDFIMSMFWILDIASMQLHPNRWAAIQVFRALCFNSYVLATPRLFLHYFYSRPQDKAQWISLI